MTDSAITAGSEILVQPQLKRLNGLWRFLQIALIAWVVVSGAWALSGLHALNFYQRIFSDPAAGDAAALAQVATVEAQQNFITVAMGVVAWACIIAYARFYQRAMANLHRLETPRAKVGPMMMWVWYVIPIASLWKPLEGVIQVWRGSREHAGLDDGVPRIIGVWWALWLAGIVIGSIDGWQSRNAISHGDIVDGDAHLLSLRLSIAGALLSAITAALLYRISARIAQAQARFISD